MPVPSWPERVATGIPELDVVLQGGLPRNRLLLIEGCPGAGKTTFGMHFLREGARCGDKALYVTLSETAEELSAAARSHGWSLDGIDIFELTPLEAELDRVQTVLQPSEVELGETMRLITDRITEAQPDRIVIDSVSELRLLARDSLRYRRQILALKRFLQGRRCTVLILDDLTTDAGGMDLHSIVHGVISLDQRDRSYGAVRRRLRIAKMRSARYQSGWHDFAITTGEILVFPSLIAEEHKADFEPEAVSSGLRDLDDLVGGGLDRGTTTMMIGPSGAGKSSLALQYVMAAVSRGEYASIFAFDETFETLSQRAAHLGLEVKEAVEAGRLGWERANPSRLSPGEFVWQVRRQVEDKKAKVVVIDSLNSYLGTMPEEQALVLQMHELLTYLNNQGVVTILILAQQGVVGETHAGIDLSFLSDTIVLLRFFEAAGEVHKAISVVKKRSGVHELAIREYRLFPEGMRVGPQLLEFHGVLTGVPTYEGLDEPLLRRDGALSAG